MTVIMELYASKVNRSRRRQWKWRWPIGQPPRNGKVVSAQVKRITQSSNGLRAIPAGFTFKVQDDSKVAGRYRRNRLFCCLHTKGFPS